MLSDKLIDALRRLPAEDAQAIVSEARQNDRQQAMQRAAAMPLWYVGGTPRTNSETEE